MLKYGVVLLLAMACTLSANAADEMSSKFSTLCDRLSSLVTKYYPKAEIEKTPTTFRAKFNTRSFMIHHPLKTGEWQDARAEEGPDKGGILCSIATADGKWAGAAMVPQTFEYWYFKSNLMAPYNKKLDKHLIVHLNYPSGAPAAFITAFCNTVEEFSESGDEQKK
jgi:hypothetical protein